MTLVSQDKAKEAYDRIKKYGIYRASEQLGVSAESVARYARFYKNSFLSPKKEARILFFDIETAPLLAYVWSIWTEVRDFKFVEGDWYCLSWAAKWMGEDKIMCKALPDYGAYKKDIEDDSDLLKELWSLLDSADIVVAHNLKKFDERKINARFILNGMSPPSAYRCVDTLLEARRNFFFTSNRLDALGKMFGIGGKIDTGGFELWRQCMLGDKKAWNTMKEYNMHDIVLLEAIYKELRPYMKSHPNMGIYNPEEGVCSKCGSTNIVETGKKVSTDVSQYDLYECRDCGAWSRGRNNTVDRKSILTKVS